jgi:hypothetical protein
LWYIILPPLKHNTNCEVNSYFSTPLSLLFHFVIKKKVKMQHSKFTHKQLHSFSLMHSHQIANFQHNFFMNSCTFWMQPGGDTRYSLKYRVVFCYWNVKRVKHHAEHCWACCDVKFHTRLRKIYIEKITVELRVSQANYLWSNRDESLAPSSLMTKKKKINIWVRGELLIDLRDCKNTHTIGRQ